MGNTLRSDMRVLTANGFSVAVILHTLLSGAGLALAAVLVEVLPAAMQVQPRVWALPPRDEDVLNVSWRCCNKLPCALGLTACMKHRHESAASSP